MKRALLALPLLAAPFLAACSDDRALNDVIPVADPLREPARAAPFEYGRPGWIGNDPARAAGSAGEIEAFTDAAENDPFWTTSRNPVLLPQLQIARREFREAFGVSPRVPSAVAARASSCRSSRSPAANSARRSASPRACLPPSPPAPSQAPRPRCGRTTSPPP